ncbi:MAG: DUF4421 family protein [Bacteroidales bacterium]|nr:DUF4421 family protein [Bacteroidales bacterium]MBN2757280.1 DUF4421 family protein [Bacteroidales bacterium]
MKKTFFCFIVFAILCKSDIYASDTLSFNATAQLEFPILGLSLYNNSSELKYSPNNSLVFKLGLQYKNLGLTFGFGSGRMDTLYNVTTKYFDFQGFYYFKKIGTDIYFQNFKGYYIDEILISDEALLPDMQTQTWTVNQYFKLGGSNNISDLISAISNNKKFSFIFFAMGSVSHRKIKSSQNLIPLSEELKLPSFNELKNFDTYCLSASAGMLLKFHTSKYYMNQSLSVGLGYPISKSDIEINNIYSIKINLKLIAGYQGNRFCTGMFVVNDSDAINYEEDYTIQFHSILINFFLKYKF